MANVRLHRAEGWFSPSEVIFETITQVVCLCKIFFAVNSHGKLVLGPSFAIDHVKDEKIKQIAARGRETILLVTEERVICMISPFERATTLFIGNALKIRCSARIIFIQTKEGYKVTCRSNDWGECATNKQLGLDPVDATHLNRHVGIQELSVGAYHCYAKLSDDSFIGWGCNTVRVHLLSLIV
jgi:hypothetical protein